jgi:hypothetical protein
MKMKAPAKAVEALKEFEEVREVIRHEMRSEFRKQAVTAITAALALIIALSWREPIELMVKQFVEWLGISNDGISSKLIVAVVITIVAAAALVVLSHWANHNEQAKKA